jgi:hypothetical protein
VNLLIRLPATYAKATGYKTVNASPFATLLNFVFVVMFVFSSASFYLA